MRRPKRYLVPHRRKREGKTDYRLRLRLLKSGMPRLVVRKSLKNIVCQIVKYEGKGDKTIVTSHSKELKKLGWKFHGGNVPSAYLTGLMCAEKAKKHKINHAVLDIGLYASTTGNRLYSALKGVLDGGLEVSHSGEILPNPERLAGKHVSEYAEKLKSSSPSRYKKVFSFYLKNKIDPKDMSEIFEQTKKKILKVKTEKGKEVKKTSPKTEK